MGGGNRKKRCNITITLIHYSPQKQSIKKKLCQPLEINKKEEWGVIGLNERNKERWLEEKEMIERGRWGGGAREEGRKV